MLRHNALRFLKRFICPPLDMRNKQYAIMARQTNWCLRLRNLTDALDYVTLPKSAVVLF